LSAVGDNDLLSGGTALASNFLDVSNNVHTLANLTENDVFAVQPARNSGGYEELASVGVWAAVGHREQAWSNVLSDKVLVGKLFAVDRFSAGSVLSSEIATLAHKAWDDSMEWTSLVAHALFAGAQRSEVLNSLRHDIVVHLEDDSTGWLAADSHIKKAGDRHGLQTICKFDLRL